MTFFNEHNLLVAGYVCKQIEKHFPCDTCKKALHAPIAPFSQQSPAEIVNLKSRGALIHPNLHFFRMLQALEECFMKHVLSPDVYKNTVNEMLKNYKFSFLCQKHAKELLAYAIKYYMRMRMRQYSIQIKTLASKVL